MSLRSRSFLRSTAARWAVVTTLGLSSTSLGCGKKDAAPDAGPAVTTAAAAPDAAGKGEEEGQPRREPEMAAADAGGAPVAPASSEPAATGLFAAPAIAMLPKDTVAVGVGVPKKLLDGIGFEQLVTTYADALKPTIDEVQEHVGKNLFTLAAWAELGFDLDGPAGVAAIDLQREGMAFFFTLKDAAAFRAALDGIFKKVGVAVTEDKVGDATVLSMGERDKGAFVMRGNVLVVVAYDRGGGAAAMAKEIAGATPEASLAGTTEFRASVKDLAADEAGGYVQFGTLAKMMTARGDSAVDASAELEKQLDAAKAAGKADEVARLEAAIADTKRWAEKRNAKHAAEEELMKSVIGDVGGLGLGLDIDGASVEAQIRLPMAGEAMLKKLVKNATGGFSIVKATKDMPIFLAAANMDLPAYMQLVETAMKAQGEDFGEVKAQLQQLAGIDFDKDIIGLFSGEVGVGVTGDIKAMMGNEAPWNLVSGGLVLGLANPDGMKALMAKLSGIEQLAKIVKWDAATSSAVIPLPIDKAVTLSVSGKNLVVSVDPELGKRLESGDASASFVANVANPKLKALLEKQDLAGVFVMPQSLSSGWIVARKHAQPAMPPIPEPADAALKEKYKEYLALKAELDKDSGHDEEVAALMGTFDKIGYTAEAVSVKDDALVGTIGQYANAPVAEIVGDLVKMTMARGGANDELRAKREHLWSLESELMRPTPVKVEEPAPKTP